LRFRRSGLLALAVSAGTGEQGEPEHLFFLLAGRGVHSRSRPSQRGEHARNAVLSAYQTTGTVRGAAKLLGISTATLLRFVELLNLWEQWRNIAEFHRLSRFYGRPLRSPLERRRYLERRR